MIVIHTTVDSLTVAETLMKRVVDERAPACAALSSPIQSLYHWQDKVEMATEWLVSFKTRRDLFERVAAIIRSHHPYQLPEIMATAVVEASPEYAAWIERETR